VVPRRQPDDRDTAGTDRLEAQKKIPGTGFQPRHAELKKTDAANGRINTKEGKRR